jgi:guanidinoacetate N-methyltransferase
MNTVDIVKVKSKNKKYTCRRKNFDITLDIKDENFISTPNPSQKNWGIDRSLEEIADDLIDIDVVSKRFIEGSEREAIQDEWAVSQAKYDDTQLIIDGQQVMQDWERPYMEAMSKTVTENGGDILELGFGMGISASYIQSYRPKSYTVIECNEDVKNNFETWQKKYPDSDTQLVLGKWQDVIHQLGTYDGIFFDTYPLSEDEFNDYVVEDVTFAAHFFETAAAHLKKGGIFTYYSNEINSVSRRHQRKLFEHFESVTFSVVNPLFPPEDCNYWWADSMMLIKAIK